MTSESGDYDMVCQRAVTLIVDLCLHNSSLLESDTCQDFIFLLSGHGQEQKHSDSTFGLLIGVFVVCGLALVVLLSFVSWRFCWLPWRNKPLLSSGPALSPCAPQLRLLTPNRSPPPLPPPQSPVPMATEKLSMREHFLRRTNACRGRPPSPLPPPGTIPSSDTCPDRCKWAVWTWATTTRSKRTNRWAWAHPAELYQQKALETEDSTKNGSGKNCGRINFSLKYDYENECLIVNILRAVTCPPKTYAARPIPTVHRKMLNPTFNESFQFPVPYDELPQRKLHMSVFDFDRFSRHDMIGEVEVENLFEMSDLSRETNIWRDIQYATSESVDLGEIMFSLCYLPTAGRLTLTVIKCRNLKAMDITGYSDPYVKVSLICDGRRLKKKKTSIKKNTLNPTYNEAIIFDIPPDSMDHVSLHISVMDYDLVGHNEIIGVMRVGCHAEGLGRDHWNEMLAYPRKPIAHWHPLLESKKSEKEWKARTASFDSQGSCPSPRPPASP
ncbi:hypothetical protein WMY93_017730 [Mugilogobius chulae]|uniref:C2 domain-containing protein n=1 Tax=Mugilogobius chulae TaxID=88201 RepID=A0AAW0NQ54_9GOBI